MSDNRLNPAAVMALIRGDITNALIASTPGGIEAQEAQGQRDLVQSMALPKKCQYCTRDQFEAMGIHFGNDIDDLFVDVTLLNGWRKVATNHSMWSELRDQHDRIRATMFYKAAFYDRDAFLCIVPFVTVQSIYHDDDKTMQIIVRNGNGSTLLESDRMHQQDYDSHDRAHALASAYLDTHYPNHRDPLAYWNEEQS